jgi:hypothetical protein
MDQASHNKIVSFIWGIAMADGAFRVGAGGLNPPKMTVADSYVDLLANLLYT